MKYNLPEAFLLTGIILLVACGGSQKPGGEPNDSILEANMIKLGKPVKMKIDSTQDRDWYKVVIPEKGYIHIGTKKVPGEIKPEVRFAEKQAWESQKHKWITSWSRLPKGLQVHQQDTLYFAIQDNHQNESSPKSFPVRAEFIKEFDSHELNNEPKQAIQQKTGQPIVSYIYPVGDRDWFTFNVDSPGYLVARSATSPEAVKTEVRYAKEDPMSGKVKPIKDYCRLPCAVRVPKKGKYHVLLLDNHHNAGSREKIKWKVDYLAEMDTAEPNDKTANAPRLSIPGTVAVAIFPTGDSDYFQLTPERDMKLVLKGQAKGNVKPEMRLYVKKELKTKAKGDWKRLPTRFSVTGGKTYFLHLRDNHHNAGSPKPFQMTVSESSKVSS